METQKEDYTLLLEPETHCSHCRKHEEPHWLFIHEASGCKVCQDCLVDYIREDIAEDHLSSFQGFEFQMTGIVKEQDRYQVTNDEYMSTGTLYDCVEAVLMRLKLI